MLRERGVDARALKGGVNAYVESGRALVPGPKP